VSLTTILEAFVLVAVVFNAAALGTAEWESRVGDRLRTGTATGGAWSARIRAVWAGATFEALVLTLVAALWFGSLGHGGWVTLFLLLGALPAGDRWLRRRPAGAPAGGESKAFVASLLKYLLAGLVCVWRLS
jgi:hypothetical protein